MPGPVKKSGVSYSYPRAFAASKPSECVPQRVVTNSEIGPEDYAKLSNDDKRHWRRKEVGVVGGQMRVRYLIRETSIDAIDVNKCDEAYAHLEAKLDGLAAFPACNTLVDHGYCQGSSKSNNKLAQNFKDFKTMNKEVQLARSDLKNGSNNIASGGTKKAAPPTGKVTK